MDCKKVKRVLSDYLANSLNPDCMDEVKKHLNECKECADSFKAVVETDNMVQLIAKEEPPEEYWENYLPKFKDKLDRAITTQSPESKKQFHIFLPKFALAFNGILILMLVLTGGLLYKKIQQVESLQFALNKKQEKTSLLVNKEMVVPVMASGEDVRKSTAKNIKLFGEMEDMFPNAIQWVVTSSDQIELGLSKNAIAKRTDARDVMPIFMKFNIVKLGETMEVVSSANMMVLSNNEVNTKLWGLSEKDYTTYRYHCLPVLRTDGKIDIRARISLDDTGLETVVTAKEGDNIELGRLRKGDTEYSVYVDIISKGLNIVESEEEEI